MSQKTTVKRMETKTDAKTVEEIRAMTTLGMGIPEDRLAKLREIHRGIRKRHGEVLDKLAK